MCAVVIRFSWVRLFGTLWIAAHQAPMSMGLARQEYWSGLLCPPPGDLPDPGIETASLKSPALAGRLFTTLAPPRKHFNTCSLSHILEMFQMTVIIFFSPLTALSKFFH